MSKYTVELYGNSPQPHLILLKDKKYMCAISYDIATNQHERDAQNIIDGLELLDELDNVRSSLSQARINLESARDEISASIVRLR